MDKKLFIPGPVDVRPDVLEKMTQPMIGHRTREISSLQERISHKLQKLMMTENTVILSTSSGSGLMEGAVRCFTKKKAAVFSIGAFGERWYKMCKANGIAADVFRSPLGQCTEPGQVRAALETGAYDLITITHNETATGVENPVRQIAEVMVDFPDVIVCMDAVSSLGGARIPVDDWGIDVCIASTQKCLGLPPGLALASVSERAIEKAKTIVNRGLYFDYVELYRFIKEKAYQYPSTPSIALMYALDYQLDRIMSEGIENRFNRHEQMAQRVRKWASEKCELFADPEHLSQTVTCIKNTTELSFSAINEAMAKKGYLLSNGYGDLKNITFRIAHMGDTTMQDIEEMLAVLDEVLKK